MEESLVSIIIPMYNARNTILKCIQSVINQSWGNIEIIAIDDGSIDGTKALVEGINNEKLKLFTQGNKGAAAARNLGIKRSKGEFILFVDADDYIEENMIEDFMKVTRENSIIFSNTFVEEKKLEYTLELFKNNRESINKEDAMKEIISGGGGLICSKLISRKIVEDNNIFFEEGLFLGEDQLFFLKAAANTDNFYFINKAYYHYDRTREESATNKYQSGLLENYLLLHKEILRVFIEKDLAFEENLAFINNKVMRWSWQCIDNEVMRNNLSFFEKHRRIKGIIKSISKEVDIKGLSSNRIEDRFLIKTFKKESNPWITSLMFISKVLMIKNS